MNSLMAPLLTALPLTALASPAPEILLKIQESYNPVIEYKVTSRGWSFYGCATEEITLRGQDPVSLETRSVQVTLYKARSSSPQSVGTVILLPPTGGVNVLDRGYANEICFAGLNVALISGWAHQEPTSIDFSIHDEGALRSLAAIRHVVEFLKTDYHGPLGVLGTSIGAIAGNLALGYESRISAAALIVGSGRFGDVVAETTEEGAKKIRYLRMKKLGIQNMDEYRKLIHEHVKTDPSSFVNFSGPKRTLLITADKDVTVPTPYQYELVDLLKPEVHIALSGDHLQVIKQSFFYHCGDILKFFKTSLKNPTP